MPRALHDFMGYRLFFWSGDKGEPVHIHVCKGEQTQNATKFWITQDGIEMEHNKSQIPENDLRKLRKYILTNREKIIVAWFQHFGFNG